MKPATRISTLLLALIAIVHAARLTYGVPVTVGAHDIPMWASVLGTVVPGILAYAMWREQRGPAT